MFIRELPEVAAQSAHPGRMSLMTALNTAMLGSSLLCLSFRSPRGPLVAQYLAIGVAANALLAVIGYTFGPQSLYQVGPYSSMALHTALLFLLLAAGVWLARPDLGLPRVVLSQALGGQMARRFWPASVGVLLTLGLIRAMAARAGLIEEDFGIAFMVWGGVLYLSAIICAMAASLNRSDEAVREQRRWLEVTLSSIGDGVIATDLDGKIVFMNDTAQELTGCGTSEAIGTPLEETFRILDEDHRLPASNPALQAIREDSVVGLANHTLLVSRYGTERGVDHNASPIRDDQGQVDGAVLIFRDITDRNQLEKELRARVEELAEADRRKDQFLAMLGHELRNPLAALESGLTLIQRDLDPDEAEWARSMVRRQVRHLARLVDELLDASRMNRGTIELRTETVQPAEVITRAVESLRTLAEKEKHQLLVSIEPNLPELQADPTRLAQLCENLLSNAIKFTPSGGRIEVSLSLSTDQSWLVLLVRDTGNGITKEFLPRLFEPFTQANTSLAREEGGLGLGLTLVKTIAALHGGTVEARSEGLGKGSEFQVSLPTSERDIFGAEAAGSSGDRPAAEDDRDSGPTRILMVEDNQDYARGLSRLLQSVGYEVRISADGPSALEQAHRWRPKIVLLDLGLPGMEGFEVAHRLRSDPASSIARIIVVSGYAGEQDRQRSQQLGIDAHLAKPVSLRELLQIMDRWERPAAS